MHAIRERRELELRSYAKINLALDVTGIRPDGYHCVDTIMQRVSLADLIQISWQPEDGADAAEPAHIIVTTTKPYLPTDRRNLAYRAAEAMLEEAKQRGYTPRGTLRIHIEKRIPVAAGLGGWQRKLRGRTDRFKPPLEAALQYTKTVRNRGDDGLRYSVLRIWRQTHRIAARGGPDAARNCEVCVSACKYSHSPSLHLSFDEGGLCGIGILVRITEHPDLQRLKSIGTKKG